MYFVIGAVEERALHGQENGENGPAFFVSAGERAVLHVRPHCATLLSAAGEHPQQLATVSAPADAAIRHGCCSSDGTHVALVYNNGDVGLFAILLQRGSPEDGRSVEEVAVLPFRNSPAIGIWCIHESLLISLADGTVLRTDWCASARVAVHLQVRTTTTFADTATVAEADAGREDERVFATEPVQRDEAPSCIVSVSAHVRRALVAAVLSTGDVCFFTPDSLATAAGEVPCSAVRGAGVQAISLCPRGLSAAISLRDGCVAVWTIMRQKENVHVMLRAMFHPRIDTHGGTVCAAWSPDGTAIAIGDSVAWELRSASGCVLSSPLTGDFAAEGTQHTSSAQANSSPTKLPSMSSVSLSTCAFVHEGFAVWHAPCCGESPCTIRVLRLARSACVRGVFASERTRLALTDGRSVFCGDADRARPFWDVLTPPDSYNAAQAPLRVVAVSADGGLVGVAGARGCAVWSRRARRWRVFGDVNQENALHCRGIAFVGPFVALVHFDTARYTYELRLYPHVHLDASSLVARVPLQRRPVAIDVQRLGGDGGADSSAVLHGSAASCSWCVVVVGSNQSIDLYSVRTSLHGQRERRGSISSTATNAAVSPGNSAKISVQHLSSAPLHCDRGSTVRTMHIVPAALEVPGTTEQATSSANPAAAQGGSSDEPPQRSPTAAKDQVAALHALLVLDNGDLVLCHCMTGKIATVPPAGRADPRWPVMTGVERVLACPARGWDVCVYGRAGVCAAAMGALSSSGAGATDTLVAYDDETYALGIAPVSGVVVAATQRVLKKQMGNRVVQMFDVRIAVQPYLHYVLRGLLSSGRDEEALSVAEEQMKSIHFGRALELLLYTTLEMAVDSGDSDLLARSCKLARQFGVFAEVVVACARKSEPSHWSVLFECCGRPSVLFELCRERGLVVVAASYLAVVRGLEGTAAANSFALSLLHDALDRRMWTLAGDLLRFIGAAEGTTGVHETTMSAAMVLSARARRLVESNRLIELLLLAKRTPFSLSLWVSTESRRCLATVRSPMSAIRMLRADLSRTDLDFGQPAEALGELLELLVRHHCVEWSIVTAAVLERVDVLRALAVTHGAVYRTFVAQWQDDVDDKSVIAALQEAAGLLRKSNSAERVSLAAAWQQHTAE